MSAPVEAAVQSAAALGAGDAALFGLVQGLTEFLPVSSSGHLALLGHWLNFHGQGMLFLTVWVHAATLAAVMGFYWRDMLGFLGLVFPPARSWAPCPEPASGKADAPQPLDGWALAGLLVLGTLPAVAAVLLGADDALETLIESPRIVAGMLMATGLVAFSTLLPAREDKALSWKLALLIGCAQALALTPGISRSGMTIAAALALGVPRGEAVRFSFLLSMPAIGGGLALTLAKGLPAGLAAGPLAAAALAAFASGLLAIWAVKKFVERGKFWLFGVYCLLAGGSALWLLG